ncbi:MAG TPA: carboxypeptidase-like regulatory domain-containing protein [Gemmatimonadaceae bacterium]|nr:carboxypeptidase-like regulatory domain-containing protein [Gemmatimonadaceae bacterium]
MTTLLARRLVAVAGLVVVPLHTHAQTIGGRLLDKSTKRPIKAVNVYAMRDTAPVAKATTDSLGVFYVDLPATGVYRLRFGEPGAAPFLSDTIVVAAGDFAQRDYAVDLTPERVFTQLDLETPVTASRTNRPPKYPESLRSRNIDGVVLAQFIVDTTAERF